MRHVGDADGVRLGCIVHVLRVVRHLSGGPIRASLLVSMNNLEQAMGNTELRLTLERIEGIAIEARDNTAYTNGKVRWHTKMIYLSMGALPLLSVWAGWLTLEVLHTAETFASSQVSTQQIQAAVNQAFANNLITPINNRTSK